MNAVSWYVAWIFGGISAAAALFGVNFLNEFRSIPDFILEFLMSIPLQRAELLQAPVFWLVSFSNLVFPVAAASSVVVFSCLRVTKEITRKAQFVALLSYVAAIAVVAVVVPAGFVSVATYLIGADTTGYDPGYERLNRVAATIFFPSCLYLTSKILSRSKLRT
jgi:uncharacterized membrane protein